MLRDQGIPTFAAFVLGFPGETNQSIQDNIKFIAEGLRLGEPGVIAVFEERPKQYLQRAKVLGPGLETMGREGHPTPRPISSRTRRRYPTCRRLHLA